MADTPTGETVTPEAPSNTQAQASVPTDNTSNTDVEAAKKEAEQARMRANQLENELSKIRADQDAAKQKQLEEEAKFKELYESERAKNEEFLAQQQAVERNAQLTAATDEVFKDYPTNVVEAAKIAGLSLTDDSESARTSLTEKLNKLQETVGIQSPVMPSNPGEQTPAQTTTAELTAPNAEGYSKMGMAMARGGKEAKEAWSEYVKAHPGMQKTYDRMKKLATEGA